MKIKLLLVAGILAIAQAVSAQQSIKGKVSDRKENSPIEYATVALMKQDSTLIAGVNTDENGLFEIPGISSGNYTLSASYIGYKTNYVSISQTQTDSYTEIMLEPSDIQLNEVTIAAKAVINKADRKLILPSDQQVKSSTDGLDLLKKIQLSRIMVDPVTSEVSMSGNGEVQLRINGVQVSSTEITALKPDDIVRIEYHDDPGSRYGKAAAVIDYITRRAESGGNIRGSLMNNIGGNKTSADDMLSMKFNHKKSEFAANAGYQRRKVDWTREYDEKFIYPDHELHRIEIGEPTAFDKRVLRSNLNYSLMEKDKYFFNAQLRYTFNNFPSAYEDRKSKLYTSDSETPLSIYDHSTEKSNSPALDLYYQQNLKNNQSLIFNIVGTYINTKNTRIYQEQREDVMETDIYSDIKGKKYSLIAEGLYERKMGLGKFTGGLKHIQTYTDNKYAGTVIADVSMRQAESNMYVEYQAKTGKFGYMLNLTGSRFYYGQDGKNTEKYYLQPSARITFEPNNDLYFRYRVNLQNNMPSLAYLNGVEQSIDPLQVRRGNPYLKSYQNLTQTFTAGYNKDIWGVELLLSYDYQYKPIMESVLYKDGLFVRTYENQKSFQNLSAEITFRLRPWKDHINISVTPALNRYISEGNNYLHTYTMGEIRANLDFIYNHFVANFMMMTPPNRYVYGEQLYKGEQMYTISAGYKKPAWAVMIGAFCPFTKTYKANNENWAALNPVKSEIHTRNMTQMFFVKCSFNLDFGKQFRTGRKQINNSDNDSGIMSGAKN